MARWLVARFRGGEMTGYPFGNTTSTSLILLIVNMQIISVSLCMSISPMASFFSCKLFTQFLFLFSLRFSFEKLKRM